MVSVESEPIMRVYDRALSGAQSPGQGIKTSFCSCTNWGLANVSYNLFAEQNVSSDVWGRTGAWVRAALVIKERDCCQTDQ